METWIIITAARIAAVLFGAVVGFVVPAAADDEDRTIRTYFSIPLGEQAVTSKDVTVGLQFTQDIKSQESAPVASFAQVPVFDLKFGTAGLTSADVMGVDFVKTLKLAEEKPKLGQNATGGVDIAVAAVVGGALGAAILCVNGQICSRSSAPPVNQCNQNAGLTVLSVNNCPTPTFRAD